MSTTTTATVLFTDIVSSTELRVALGEARADQLRREHDDIVSAEVRRHGGQVVKGSGDGVLATFTSAADALAAAVAIQRALAGYARRPDAVAAFDVRVGLSAGDVVFEDGDCFGTPVIEAARLVSACDPGHILCAEIVRMLAHGRGGHEMTSLGFLELKGLPEPLAVWDVAWVTAPTDAHTPLPSEIEADLERPLVGRAPELEAAHELIHEAKRRRPAVVWLAGEPGIGKTRLAAEIARRSHEAGATVLYGRCDEDLSVPYQPFVEALRGFLSMTPDDVLPARLGDMAGDLTLLVPELAQRLPGLPPAVEAGSETRQWRLFAAVDAWMAAASSSGPLVVLLDDLHWATEQTLQLVGHLARSAEASRAALVVTARNTAPDETSKLRDLGDDLAVKVPSFRRFDLGGLDADAVAELVSLAGAAAAESGDVARLHRETAGNPLYIASLLAGGATDVPTDLAGAVRRRVDRLPGEAGALLRTAAVIGLDVDLRVLAAAAEVDEDRAIDAMETARLAGMVHPAGADGYRFTHALVRAALRNDIGEVRRPRVHARVGRAIVDVYGSRLEQWADALAYHFGEAAGAGLEIDRAFQWAMVAADRADAVGSYPEAARHYGRALELLDAGAAADGHGATELLVARGVALRRAGDTPAALSAFRDAADLARATGDAVALGRAAVAFEDSTWRPGIRALETAALVDEAIAALGPGDTDLHLLLRASRVRAQYFIRGALSDDEADEVTALARSRDPGTVAAVMARTQWTYTGSDLTTRRPGALEIYGEWAAAAARANDGDLMLESIHSALPLYVEEGEMNTYRSQLAEMEDLLVRHPIPFWQYVAVNHRQWQAFFAADLDEAERLADGALELGRTLRGEDPSGIHGLRLFLIRREQDRLAELTPLVRTIVQLNPTAAMWRPGLAALLADVGMHDDARRHVEELCRDDLAAVPRDALWIMCLAFLADACRALGDADHAQLLYRLLQPWAQRNLIIAVFVTCLGSSDRVLGSLAATAGRHDDAVAHLEDAVGHNRELGTPLWEAHSYYELARVLHERGRPDDAPRIGRVLDDAATLAARHGLVALARRIASLRALVR